MPGGTLSVEVVQKKHERHDVAGNLLLIVNTVRDSAADLIVFPEMFLTGYTIGDDVFQMALESTSSLFDPLKKMLSESGKYVVLGFPERSTEIRGQVFNSALVIGPDGVMDTYRKSHLVDLGPFEEYSYYTPGNSLPIFEIKGMRFGIIICYDIFFPELTKYYALNGADCVICISASPSVTRDLFEILMKARAVENTIYFVYANLLGFDGRMDFGGGGAVIDPRGKEIAKGPYFEEGKVIANIDPRVIELTRKLRPTLRDTRAIPLDKLYKPPDFE
ncbi:MAG: carbon-nitrogen hydrolase family protein [Thermoplasmata archaeon]|nr:carbon-nitrogen hydrolase family protein [Thermoplasmata archaeon]